MLIPHLRMKRIRFLFRLLFGFLEETVATHEEDLLASSSPTTTRAAGLKPAATEKLQRRSKMPAAPMPPPMHMVTMP
jgi:hypothetical protein